MGTKRRRFTPKQKAQAVETAQTSGDRRTTTEDQPREILLLFRAVTAVTVHDENAGRRLLAPLIPAFMLITPFIGCELNETGGHLLMIGPLLVLGVGGEVVFARTQIPDVVWLILAGVSLRLTGLLDPSVLDPVLPLFSAVTLIVILFDGGRQIVIEDLIRAAPRASAMALLSFVLAVAGVAVLLEAAALIGLLPDSWSLLHSLMVGAILGGSSSLVIMPSMALAKVEPRVSSLVGLESSLTDALCVVVAVVFMKLIASGQASGTDAAITLTENFGLAIISGLVAGWAWMPVLRALSGSQHAYPITLAALFFLSVGVEGLGGNSAMAILTFSVVVGNAESLMTKVGFSLGDTPLRLDDTVVAAHTQIAFIIKSFFFTYIGLMLAPPWSLLGLGSVVGLVLYAARIPAARVVARPPAFSSSERDLIAIALPRGMAAGVLATLPAAAGVAGTENLPSLVFSAVATTIAVFAIGFRRVRGSSNMHENQAQAQAQASGDGGLASSPPATTGLPITTAAVGPSPATARAPEFGEEPRGVVFTPVEHVVWPGEEQVQPAQGGPRDDGYGQDPR